MTDLGISIYEENKNSIHKYLTKLDLECKKLMGPMNRYVPPSKNAYRYLDAEEYKDIIVGTNQKQHIIKNCKFTPDNNKPYSANNRYYEDILSKKECNYGYGTWDENGLNRKNKVAKGVCWVDPKDKECSDALDTRLLKAPYSKFKDMSAEIIKNTDTCNAIENCAFKKTSKYTYDCIQSNEKKMDKTKIEEEEGPVMRASKDMPSVNDPKLEEYLKNWYESDKSPDTSELLGKGNRCVNTIVEDDIKKPDDIILKTYIDFIQLDPRKKEDAELLRSKMPSEIVFKNYKSHWIHYNKDFTKSHVLKHFYHRMIDQQLKGTEALEEEDNTVKAVKTKVAKKGFLPSIPQSVVNIIMKRIAETNDNKRGMLAWHSTGSGKTATATGVIDAFWETDRPIIFASSIDAVASNPDYKFHEYAMNLFPRFQQGIYKGNSREESMALIAQAFKKRNIRFLSFAKLSHRVEHAVDYKKEHKLVGGFIRDGSRVGGDKVVKVKSHADILNGESYVDLTNAILIIDEVHNLFRPLANQKKEHEYLEKFIIDPTRFPNMKVVILTATPGDNIPDVIKLLNAVRDYNKPVIKVPDINSAESMDRFKDHIKGLVSFFDMSNDRTKFPDLIDKQVFIKAPMSDIQYAKYIEAYKTVAVSNKNFIKLSKDNKVSKYWEGPRKYANTLFNFEKDMSLKDFSGKMPYLLENILKFPDEKQYVYSAFYTRAGYGGHGVVAIGKELEKLGYTKLTVKDAKKFNKAEILPPKGKRYILVISTELGEESGNAGKNLDELLKIYNHKDNKNGELIHVMLASQSYNEGIDLKDLRQIHFFEPLVTMASDKQAIGRGRRYCSHSNLEYNQWYVQIHRYMSEPPIIVKIDNTEIIAKLKSDIFDLENKIVTFSNKDSISQMILELKNKEAQYKAIKKVKGSTAGILSEIDALETDITKNKLAYDANKEYISGYKIELKEKEKILKKLSEIQKKPVENIENIEERIFKESRERMKELLVVYNALKEAAIDCKSLNEFHSSISSSEDLKIKCHQF